MSLTDYISPVVLAEAGYIHESQSAVMLEHIDRSVMSEQGWVNLKHLGNVGISLALAAEIIGVCVPTLQDYIKLGYIRKDAYGKVGLLDAINFDYKLAKKHYLNSKKV